MEKHLMVCVCADGAASYAVRFIKDFFNSPCDVRITLFHVAPPKGSWCTVNPLKKGRQLLEETREWFINHSFCDESRIDIKSIHSRGSTAREIVQEGYKGMYDAVLMGRQTPSMLEEFFDYSVGNKVIWEQIDFPLWFCKCPLDIPKKDILLCVDEDAPSQRIADHVGYMLSDNLNHDITMLYVYNPKKEGAATAEDVFALSRKHLVANGIDAQRIKELVLEGSNVAQTILDHTAEKNYAVVAAGRGVHDQTAREKLFPRSVCVKLLQGLEVTALWISR
ncbi:universal stress protein [Maridesulfovibrio hydrothermalis]|uniref:UspA domain protein n=1 Tax=Maridesulfovibrio hydrothermalis AM13 = DSM 14728 TaxID=1121451 RepID=L0R9J5_9BACT|nr:universal stress protein [Maridesulfovibrio hydrothermalis]CCO22870.1 UspA domain protein [Maridesulfovibrio hydrothermalis AM13 = DSM 14728]